MYPQQPSGIIKSPMIQANLQQPGRMIRPLPQQEAPMRPPMIQGLNYSSQLGPVQPPMVQGNPPQLRANQIRPLPLQGNPQQLGGPIKPSPQGNPQQLGGPMRPLLQGNLQQFGGPMRPPMMQEINQPQQLGGGVIKSSMMEGNLQQPIGLVNLPVMQGISKPQYIGRSVVPSMMQDNLQQSIGSIKPLSGPPLMKSNLQQSEVMMRPHVMQTNLQQFGGPMRPPLMQGNVQQLRGPIRPLMMQGMNQPQSSMGQNNMQQEGRGIRPPFGNLQQSQGFIGQPMMQEMKTQMPIRPPPLPLEPRRSSSGAPQMLPVQPDAIEKFQQNQISNGLQQSQQFEVDINNDLDLDEFQEGTLLEPLSSFDTTESNIQLNYTQLFSFHVSYNNLNSNGQPQRGRWFNIGKKAYSQPL